MSDNYKFFQNKECEYFPCHKTADPENFSCMFCYCPLYALGDHCGGDFRYNKKGIKDCTLCAVPHSKENYDTIIDKTRLLIEMVRKKDYAEE